jgi:hypothetical protein
MYETNRDPKLQFPSHALFWHGNINDMEGSGFPLSSFCIVGRSFYVNNKLFQTIVLTFFDIK